MIPGGFHLSQNPSQGPHHQEEFRFSDDAFEPVSAKVDGLKVAQALATQDGLIKGLQTALSSVQGSISATQTSFAAWLTVVGSIAALLTATLFGIGIFNLTRTAAVGDRVDGASGRVSAVETRLAGVEVQVARTNDRLDILPQQVVRELQAAQLAAAASSPTQKPK